MEQLPGVCSVDEPGLVRIPEQPGGSMAHELLPTPHRELLLDQVTFIVQIELEAEKNTIEITDSSSSSEEDFVKPKRV